MDIIELPVEKKNVIDWPKLNGTVHEAGLKVSISGTLAKPLMVINTLTAWTRLPLLGRSLNKFAFANIARFTSVRYSTRKLSNNYKLAATFSSHPDKPAIRIPDIADPTGKMLVVFKVR